MTSNISKANVKQFFTGMNDREMEGLVFLSISSIVLIILCVIGTVHIIILCILHFFNPYLDQKTKDNLNNTNKDMNKFRNKYILGMK